MSEAMGVRPDQKSPASKWLMPAKLPPGRKLTLWCFPYAGGGGSGFHTLRRLAPPWLAVQSVQLPARETRIREPAIKHMKPMIAALMESVAPAMEGPTAFLGYSMGSLIALEFARELRRKGLPGPVHLIAAAHRAPQVPNILPMMHTMADEQLRQEAQLRFGQTNSAMADPELAKLLLPILRGDLELCETYDHQMEEPLSCPISILGGSEDEIVPPAQLEGWSVHSGVGSDLRLFPGGHFFLFGETEAGFAWICERLAAHAN